MSNKISPLISPSDLIPVAQNEEIILIDASAGSRARYDENHLTGALFMDVNTDLATIDDYAIGGRHPLPDPADFSLTLGKFGISKESHVVIYDDKQGGNAAARLWWMLKSIGHGKVQVIDGGFQAAVNAGFPTSNRVESIKKATSVYEIATWNLPLSDIDEVENVSQKTGYAVIDVRDANRYAGLTEPIDLIAGHIPGAINIPYTENMDAQGFFLPPEVLKEKYSKVLEGLNPQQVIVHCGSGITACHTLLAMAYADLPIPKLYVGSWSEWSRNNKEMILAEK